MPALRLPRPALALPAVVTLVSCAGAPEMVRPPTPAPGSVLVVAHRGASGYRPEHTLEAYALAIEMGADYVEADLVITRDGVLVCRHENEVSTTTDVARHPEFAGRRTTKVVDGVPVTGWFTEDFTLAELRSLRARERLPQLRPANAAYDGRFAIPTFEEVVALVRRRSRELGRPIGLYPETKRPTYFDGLGLSLEEPLVAVLHGAGYTGPDDPVFIQSFEVQNLRVLRTMTRLRLVQLVAADGAPYDFTASGDPRSYASLVTPLGLAEVATYADGIGPQKDLVVPRGTDGRLLAPTALVRNAHAAGLVVHAWTFRSESAFLPADLRRGDPPGPAATARGDAAAEYHAFFRAGVDGVFSDHLDDALEARRSHATSVRPWSEGPP